MHAAAPPPRYPAYGECPHELLIVSGPEPYKQNPKSHRNKRALLELHRHMSHSPTTFIVTLRPRTIVYQQNILISS